MDADTLQFQAETNTLIVRGVAFQLDLMPLALPGGLYKYGQASRLTGNDEPSRLTSAQAMTLNDSWPFLVGLAVEVYAGQWIQTVTGPQTQQLEDIIYQLAQARAGITLTADEVSDATKLAAWIFEVRQIRAEKLASLEQPDALVDFDLFADWPTYPPAGY